MTIEVKLPGNTFRGVVKMSKRRCVEVHDYEIDGNVITGIGAAGVTASVYFAPADESCVFSADVVCDESGAYRFELPQAPCECDLLQVMRVYENTGETKEFDNLITDLGLEGLNSGTGLYYQNGSSDPTRFVVGVGNTPASYTDTGIESPVAGISVAASGVTDTLANSGAPDYYSSRVTRMTFALGAVVGNLAECGIVNGTSNTSAALTRALLKEGGSPITFPVTAVEQLIATYEIRSYPPLEDTTGVFLVEHYDGSTLVDTVEHTYVSRCIRVQAAPSAASVLQPEVTSGLSLFNRYGPGDLFMAESGAGRMVAMAGESSELFAPTANASMRDNAAPMGSAVGVSSTVDHPYVPGSFERVNEVRLAANAANFPTGIGHIRVGSSGIPSNGRWWAVSITPKIPKDADRTLELTFKMSTGRA